MVNRRQVGKAMLASVGTCALLGWTAAATPTFAADKVVIFAAASLKNAIDAVDAAWKADTGKEAVASYGASSALAKQVESGAPADVFISADLDWADYLESRQLLRAGSRANLVGNELVLVLSLIHI